LAEATLMLKHWRVSFNPTTEHFKLCHLWVLLPGLPLYLWNEGALRAIGDNLGKFISLESKCFTNPERKLGSILVEMDIHCGLPESIDIEWRGRRVVQQLDYLGIPFRCNACRQMGHLRRDCTGKEVEEVSENTELQRDPPEYMDEAESFGCTDHHTGLSTSHWREDHSTLMGKLQSLCPSLFSSLTYWEKEALNTSNWLTSSTSSLCQPDKEMTPSEPLPPSFPKSLRY
jgi:hypothetical protein